MSRFPRLRRRPDHWPSAHDRARVRAAERLDGPLGLAEASWLDEHLANCAECTAVATAYVAERDALRALRSQTPEPPRDLWARTAAAIEQESAGSGRDAERRTASRSRLPLGAIAGVAVIALVIGVSTLSGGTFRIGGTGSTPGASPDVAILASPTAAASAAAEATPIAVGAGDVTWIDAGPGGRPGLAAVNVDRVCPAQVSDCPMVGEGRRLQVALTRAPRTIIGSPTRREAVAIDDNGVAGDQLLIVDLPEATATPAPTASTPPATPTPVPTRTVAPSTSPSPTASPSDGSTPASPEPSPSSDPVSSPTPSAGSSATPTATPTASPTVSPEPTIATAIAIASNIDVVGESAAFSADGAWFAFTARPTDRSTGPNVYVWRVGDGQAHALTTDGTTYFGSWAGDELVASRPANPAGPTSTVVTVRIDPANGTETRLGDLWRPVVDPSGTLAIGWAGTIEQHPDGTWAPAFGALELRSWSSRGAGRDRSHRDARVVADHAPGDFDIRWDGSGEWVAAWVADAQDPAIGRLSLFRVDTRDERLARVDGGPHDVPALLGFSIGEGRLAWATPPGQGGEGSRIQIAAWSAGDVGTVESTPGDGIVVVR
ncbi:MAG TPA: zf-HC2 domain-containing protein [Candidatus Limnocylindrales bacterium]|jgi:hypothetical protein|nr:zf-HC2 domain-containing protein [Candidatus Limnocylindrales bacterium]